MCNVCYDIIMFHLTVHIVLCLSLFMFASVASCYRHDSVKTTDENFWTEAYSLNCSTALITSVLYHLFPSCYHIAVILANLKHVILMHGVSW